MIFLLPLLRPYTVQKLSVDNIYFDFFGLPEVQSANIVVDRFKTHTAANHHGAGGYKQGAKNGSFLDS